MARQIIGPDVSFYQDDPGTPQGIDFARLDQAADFIIIRAGQNLWADSDFKNNWSKAKATGLPRGSYWFYDSRADPKQQADLWFNLLGGDLGELPLFLDLEETYRGMFTGWQHWKTFLERLKTLAGSKEVGIYTAYSYWNTNAPFSQLTELEYFHRYPLWIANYGVSQPLVPKPWSASEWLFWQFTASGDGPTYGAESLEIDLNYFNGDAQVFAQRFNVPVPPDPTPVPTGVRYRVNAGTLNVREGPGTSYKAIGFFQRNDTVESLESSADGGWLRVRRLTDGLTGWVASLYLVRLTTPPPPPPPTTGDRYKVTAGSLYVREGPGANFKAIASLQRNDIVEALEFSADRAWIHVRRLTDNLTGWSSSQYLEKIDTPPPPPPPPPPPTTGDKYRVTANRLNVREGPGLEFKVIAIIELNEVVTSIGVNPDGTWRQIRRSDGLMGWSSAQYLVPVTEPPPGPPGPPPDISGKWYRSTGTINVREGAGTNFATVGTLNKDEVVEGLSTTSDQSWIRFRRVDGWTAWASSNYLTDVGKTPNSIKQNIFKGVTYYRTLRTTPRVLTTHVLAIDTKSVESLRFLVTPPVRDTIPQLCTRTTSLFLDDNDLQIAVNGDEFYYMNPRDFPPQNYCANGDPVRPAGFAASRGRVYSEKLPGRPVLYMNQKDDLDFDAPKGKVYNAISGERFLVNKGKKVNGLDTEQLQPRTAVGINRNSRWLYLVVMDGREASEGASFSELADLLLSYGVYTGMSFDGGGSSTMVIEGVDKQPRVLNTPVNDQVAGRERGVANHLGISLKKS